MSQFLQQVPLETLTRPGPVARSVNAAFDLFTTVGNVLDTPGSVVRGLLAGEDERAFGGIFDTSQRVSGTELAGGRKDDFSWGGLGLEILTDPFTFFSLGTLTTAGKLAKRAGGLQDTIKALEVMATGGTKPEIGTLDRLVSAKKALAGVKKQAEEAGLRIEPFEKRLRDRLITGQSAAIQVGLPFVEKRIPVAELRGLGELVGFTEELLGPVINHKVYKGTVDPIKGLGKSTKKLFSTRLDNNVLNEMRKEYKNLNREVNRRSLLKHEAYLKQIAGLELNNPNLDLEKLTRRLIEDTKAVRPGDIHDKNPRVRKRMRKLYAAKIAIEEEYGAIPDEIWTFAKQIHDENQLFLADELAAGAAVQELPYMGYVARLMTREGQELLATGKGKSALVKFIESQPGGLSAGFQRQRIFRDKSIDELNVLMRKLYDKGDDFDFFDSDLARIQLSRSMASGHAGNRARFAEAVVKQFGKKLDDIAADEGVSVARLVGKSEARDKAGKIFYGPLVTSTFLPGSRNLSMFVARHVDKKSKMVTTKSGQKSINGITVNLDEGSGLMDQAIVFADKETFRAKSDVHAAMDNRFSALQKAGSLDEQHVRLLRVLTSQLDEDELEFLRIEGGTELNINYKLSQGHDPTVQGEAGVLPLGQTDPATATHVPGEPLIAPGVMDARTQRDTNDIGGAFMNVNSEIADDIESLGKRAGKSPEEIAAVQARQRDAQMKTFLHELGHVMSFSIAQKNPAFWDNLLDDWVSIRALGDVQNENTLGLGNNNFFPLSIRESISRSRLDQLDIFGNTVDTAGEIVDNSDYFAHRPSEWFAETFAQWMLGKRVPEEMVAAMETTNKSFRLFRQALEESDRFSTDGFARSLALDGQTVSNQNLAQAFMAGKTDDLDVAKWFPHLLQEDVEFFNSLPLNQRRSFIAELLEPEFVRETRVDIPVNASEKEIVKIMADAGIETTHVEPEIFEAFQTITKLKRWTPDTDTFMGKFINASDQIHGLYRTALTQYFPAFHARNLISNVFLNTLAGVSSPVHYLEAMNKLKKMTDEDLVYLAGLGVLDEGKLKESISILKASKGTIINRTKDIGALPGTIIGKGDELREVGKKLDLKVRHTGLLIENHTRYAHFLAMKKRGLSDSEAADSVAKFLFDYSDLTDFERAVPRRGMLFYTFYRKNLPLMMETSFKDPKFMVNYARVTGTTNSNIPAPDWMPPSFFFGENEKGQAIRANFGLPPEDLSRFDPEGKGIGRVFELMIGNLVPAIKVPFEIASGRDIFRGRPAEGHTGKRLLVDQAPLSRAINTGSGFFGDEPGAHAFRTLTGVNVKQIDQDVQIKLNQVEAIRDRLDELVRGGKARKIEIVGQRKGKDIKEIAQLNRMQAQLQRQLSQLREQ